MLCGEKYQFAPQICGGNRIFAPHKRMKKVKVMDQYIWQNPQWPHFEWKESEFVVQLAQVRLKQGKLIGRISALGFESELNTALEVMTDDLVKSSEIEGVSLDGKMVRSSLSYQLGLNREGLPVPSRYVDGLVEVMVDAVKFSAQPVAQERLFGWHRALFPNGANFKVGGWRTGTMQVISGAIGHEKIHFEAPSPQQVPTMMDEFLDWANGEQQIDPIIKAAVIALWFVTIHPFGDGNGRLSRTLTDLFLTRSDGMTHRFYSMSAAICKNRSAYYDILEKTQKGGMDVTPWIVWFLSCLDEALQHTEVIIAKVLEKSAFWEQHKDMDVNERQRKIIDRLLEGFDGKLTTSKWAKICQCSSDTALRDLDDLVKKRILKVQGVGRGTFYVLC